MSCYERPAHRGIVFITFFLLQLSFAWDKPETADGLMRLKPRKPGKRFSFYELKILIHCDLTTVNERSIRSLKRKALRRTKTLGRDPETQEVIQPSRFSVWLSKLKNPFTRAFWEDLMETTDNESLVDGKLLSYSYLEAGIIETLATYVLLFFLGIKFLTFLIGLLLISSYFSVTDLHPLILSVRRRAVVCNLFNFC